MIALAALYHRSERLSERVWRVVGGVPRDFINASQRSDEANTFETALKIVLGDTGHRGVAEVARMEPLTPPYFPYRDKALKLLFVSDVWREKIFARLVNDSCSKFQIID